MALSQKFGQICQLSQVLLSIEEAGIIDYLVIKLFL
jgi:hypothetical protein